MEIALILLAAVLLGGWMLGSMVLTVVFVFAAALLGEREYLRRNLKLAALWPIALLIWKDGDLN